MNGDIVGNSMASGTYTVEMMTVIIMLTSSIDGDGRSVSFMQNNNKSSVD